MPKNTDYSRAKSGQGVENPDDITNYNVTRGGKRVALIIRWSGNGYNKKDCWLRGDLDTVVDLDNNL